MPHSHTTPEEFREQRRIGQERLMSVEHQGIKRFLNLDTAAYRDTTAEGGLDGATKELLGLVASAVLRCDDCIRYHLEQCVKAGVPRQHIIESLNIALVVGGSIFIPHFRRGLLFLDDLLAERG